MRELDVLLGKATGIVAGQREMNLVPADVDIGVVVGFFSLFCGAVDENHGNSEVREFEVGDELIAVLVPIVQSLQLPGDLCGIE